jgi:hypothetical protein
MEDLRQEMGKNLQIRKDYLNGVPECQVEGAFLINIKSQLEIPNKVEKAVYNLIDIQHQLDIPQEGLNLLDRAIIKCGLI